MCLTDHYPANQTKPGWLQGSDDQYNTCTRCSSWRSESPTWCHERICTFQCLVCWVQEVRSLLSAWYLHHSLPFSFVQIHGSTPDWHWRNRLIISNKAISAIKPNKNPAGKVPERDRRIPVQLDGLSLTHTIVCVLIFVWSSLIPYILVYILASQELQNLVKKGITTKLKSI